MQDIFEEHTGKRIGNNLLRDSFITYVYGKDINDRLKKSIAEHMGHTVETAEKHYNRMPSIQKRRAGLELASELVETTLQKERDQDIIKASHKEGGKRTGTPKLCENKNDPPYLDSTGVKLPECNVWISLRD
jgi:uncharacterized protein Yka (UPF0111/DUF47 family)